MRFKITLLLLVWLKIAPTYAYQKVVLHSRLGAGFFAEMSTVLSYIVRMACNKESAGELDVRWVDEFFPYKNKKNENGWDLFFYPIGPILCLRNIPISEVIHAQNCLKKWLNYDDFYEYRCQMHKLIERYIKIRERIISEVESYYHTYMENKIAIGVHVRFAAAHHREKPGLVRVTDYFDEIDTLLDNMRLQQKEYIIYLATDSDYVVKEFRKKYKDHVISIQALRSERNGEVHLIYSNTYYWLHHPQDFHKKKPGYKGGKDVLMDCLLLSKCHCFIHTMSNVSDFVTFFNPNIESIFLPKKITKKVSICSACQVEHKWHTLL